MARYEEISASQVRLVSEDGAVSVLLFAVNGAPTSGTSGTKAGEAPTGSLCIDASNGALYQNTNTKASPLWTLAGIQTT